MDPNVTRNRMRQLAERVANDDYPERPLSATAQGLKLSDAEELAELTIAMDDWLRARGFLPAAWER